MALSAGEENEELSRRFLAVRQRTQAICAPLAPDDQVVQSMPEASPAKWHLGHTTWFFDRFIARRLPGETARVRPEFDFIFNSYYETIGPRLAKPLRGTLSRPTLEEVRAYRSSLEEAILDFLYSQQVLGRALDDEIRSLLTLGLHHEQQHQELLLMDIQHLFYAHPFRPSYDPPPERDTDPPAQAALAGAHASEWREFEGGLGWLGRDSAGDFAFDNEGPAHRVFLEPFRIASRLVTNAEYLEFIGDGGYRRPELWLSDGWRLVQERGWKSPLYWDNYGSHDCWWQMRITGMQPLKPGEPVSNVSYYEADAFARWRGARLPTEAEWETAARARLPGVEGLFGSAWQWTSSGYSPYPGFRPLEGPLGEYNGKFMCGQMVLRGSSWATPAGHSRPSYRNFYPPESRWQFSGIRLARSGEAA